ncbi:amino acid adenylation domain-containing protein [Streptomyces sp. NPDC048484]|uniref:amino acid adenylation domain-containing protein n=1 Tax=Streptomyces sp. NPDC048484 TaxID=3155146 RepID=UPI0034338D83
MMTASETATGARNRTIENIYPLTGLQQGMLLHTRLAPEPGMHWAQYGYLLEGALELSALRRAWELVFVRHEVLRSAVVWDGVPVPVAVVSREISLPWQVVDASDLDEEGRLQAVDHYLAEDAARGADFTAPSLTRVAVIRLASDRHQLVWSHHQMMLDGWSVPIVIGEVLEAYDAFRSGRPPQLPARAPFREFVAWAARQDEDEARRYWRQYLAGVGEPTTLGVECATGDEGQALYPVELSPAVRGDGLMEFARRHRLTLNTVVQGAWALLMSVYSGFDDIVFGVTSSGRGGQIDGVDSMVGLLINTTPVRVRLDRDRPLTEWLAAFQEEQVRARQFEHTPLVTIAASSGLAAGRPLFHSLFVFENYPVADLEEGTERSAASGLRVDRNLVGQQADQPLVAIAGWRSEFTMRIAYDRARYDASTVARLAEHLAAVLDAIAADKAHRVGDLPALTAAERAKLLGAWNDTATGLPGVGGVHELIAERAMARPDAVAVVCDGVSLTYAGLVERAGRVACHLRAAGVRAESVVGLRLGRGVDMIVAVLGVWQAGGAYLPLDPEYPSDRLEFMVADSRAGAVIGPAEMATALAGPSSAVQAVVHPDQLAYVIYTSGSTGRPKGVQVTHGGVVNLVVGQRPSFAVRHGDAVVQFASFGFDAAVSEMCVTLAGGGTLVVATAEQRLEPRALTNLLRSEGVALATLPPSLLRVLTPAALDGVRTVVAAGERLDTDLAATWARRHRLLNAYGPTETTVCASIGVVEDGVVEDGVPSIGTPIANTRVYVLDKRLHPVPAGVAGELFISGRPVARGYGGRPALTAERFLPDPFRADGSRMYRTGDRVRWLPEGRLEFLGRADDQVKVRGFRIEPGEVEAVLTAHPRVGSAAVTAFGEGTARHLVAHLVPADPSEGIPDVAELRAFTQESLPAHMVPSAVIELAALPLTGNGKTDRAALPPPDGVRPTRAGYAEPATPAEELLAGIWAQVLGLDRVGAEDDFFELGGHSLLATQVLSRVRDVFGAEVPLAALFDQRTVRGLAGVVEGRATQGEAPPPILAVDRDEPLPLSFAQQRLWFLNQMEPGSAEYNAPSSMKWSGALDVRALTAALTAVVTRHEILRTRLVAGPDGVPHQVIDPPAPAPLPVIDVSAATDPLSAARRLTTADATTPFDLATGPLLRSALIRIRPDEHLLVLTLHHVVVDDWSVRILRREVSALYEAFAAGEPDPLAPLAVQYADFTVWQRQWLSGEVMARQLTYWQSRLGGAPVLELPTDRPRPPVRSNEGGVISFTVPETVATGLRAVACDAGATLFMTLLAAVAVVLGRYGGGHDVVIGTPVAGRNRVETEDLVGFFVNTLVLRTDLSGDPAFSELLGRVRRTALDAYAHQDLPFEQLVDALATERDRSRTPLFQVLVSHVVGEPGDDDAAVTSGGDTADRDTWSGDTSGGDTPDEALPVKYDLLVTLAGTASGGCLTGVIEYSTALFDATTVQRLAGHLGTVLEAVAEDSGRPLSRLPMLTRTERAALTDEWKGIPAAAAGVPERIAARAAADPDAVALVCDGASLTYGGLIARANRLAHHLRAAGVGAESIVGLCLPRSIDMVVGMVATWQAGGAYLPLDPGYPAERLTFMLADSGARVLVARGGLEAGLAAGGTVTVRLDDPAVTSALAASPVTAPDVTRHPAQLAYMIYTSGSTGRPKGVQVEHAGVANMAAALRPVLGAGPGVRVLQFASFSFDAASLDVAVVLAAGGTLAVATSAERDDPEALTYLINDGALQATSVTPSLLGVLDPAGLPGLRTLLLGAERLTAQVAAEWAPGRRLVNTYGPTEATVMVTSGAVDPGARAAPPIGTPPIGTAVEGNRLLVLDECLRPVPIGAPAELFIGGVQVARGYGGRPALTAERFVADPFAGDGSRLYRTGDRVRRRDDGQLDFLGRVDQQMKVRGFRIEPGEIDATLVTHPGVRSALTTAWDEDGERRLVSYLVPADHTTGVPGFGELRAHLRRSLPEFMIPTLFVELAALPTNPNGKLDRAALPAPDGARPAPAGSYVAPTGEAEETMAAIWARVLGVDRVGAEDDFFELGGHSLLATQVISRVRTTFGTEIPLSALFDRPTVRALAADVVERILAEMEQLSEAEVLQLLDADSPDATTDEDGVTR